MENKQKILRLLIFLVGISIPFNNLAITAGRNFSMGFLSTAIYFLALWPITSSRWRIRPFYGGVYLLPFYFIILLSIVNLLNLGSYNAPIFNTTMFLCFLMFMALLIHAQIDEKALSICLWGVAFGGILMSILFSLGIAVEIDEDMRLSMFNENSNGLGIYESIGIIIVLNEFIFYDRLRIGMFRFIFVLSLVPMVALLLATASRTAFLILALSVFLSVLFVNVKVNRLAKIIIIIGGLSGCFYAYEKLSNSDLLIVTRLLRSKEEKSLSGRDDIWKSVLPYGMKKPILGWGETGYVDVSKQATGIIKYDGTIAHGYSPHNVFVEVFMYTGIIGLLIMCLFWFRITNDAYILFKKFHNLLPLLLLIPIYACLLSGQLLTAKWAFVVYAYILSDYYYKNNGCYLR